MRVRSVLLGVWLLSWHAWACADGVFSIGVGVGDPFYPYGRFPWLHGPIFMPPTVVVVPPTPPVVYIEQASPLEAGYWYYCFAPPGYHPEVKQCPGGWRKVAPLPPHEAAK